MAVACRMLGRFQIIVDGVDVTPSAPKERGLLALLALNAGHVASIEEVCRR